MEASQIMEILLRILTLRRTTSEFRLFCFLPFIVCVILFYNTFYFRHMTGLSGIVKAPQIAAGVRQGQDNLTEPIHLHPGFKFSVFLLLG